MGFVEKLVTIFSVLIVVANGSLVTFYTIVPRNSGIPDEAIESEIILNEWLDDEQNPGQRGQKFVNVQEISQIVRKIRKKTGAKKALSKSQIAAKTKSAKFDNYFESSGKAVPKDEAHPQIPWIRIQEGVRYVKPKRVSPLMYKKVQHFQDAFDSAKDGGGEFEETEFGPAYRINWVKPKSHLSKVAGLQPGDKILSVNGHKIGNSFTAARQLYDQLKNEKKFAVKVLREGQPTMLSFSVK